MYPHPHHQTTLTIQEELKAARFRSLGVEVQRSPHPEKGLWLYTDAATRSRSTGASP